MYTVKHVTYKTPSGRWTVRHVVVKKPYRRAPYGQWESTVNKPTPPQETPHA